MAEPEKPESSSSESSSSEPSAPEPPPNLRVATDENKECDVCEYYDRGKCTKYSRLPVDGEWTCDSFEKDPSKSDPDNVSRDKQPQTLKGAAAETKRRFAAARK